MGVSTHGIKKTAVNIDFIGWPISNFVAVS